MQSEKFRRFFGLWHQNGRVKKIPDDLKEQHKKYRGAKRKAINALIRYISTNEEQMRYDVFRAKGYDIGSGALVSMLLASD